MRSWKATGALIGALFLLASTAQAAAQQGGTVRPYTLKADSAWLDGGRRVSPAYLTIGQDGRIQSLSRFRPRGGKVEEHEGIFAAGIVDAWSRLIPSDLMTNRRTLGYAKLSDSLPVDLPGADVQLADRVRAARRAGIAAAYLTNGASTLYRGLGATVTFSRNDLPIPSSERFLEFATGSAYSSGARSLASVDQLIKRFEAAEGRRLSFEEYEEKLEKYEKDLEEYQKKLDEYAKKKKEEKKEGAGAAQDPKQGGKSEKKKDDAPKRPKRPRRPDRDPLLDEILAAIDGERTVRVEANSAHDLLKLIGLKQQYELEMVIAGGAEADLVAEQIADAEIPIVLAATTRHFMVEGVPRRDFTQRFLALHEAGVTVAIGSGGADGGQAMMLFRAGELVAAGAEPSAVWDALTIVPARILGLNSDAGSLTSGSVADFLLFEGSSPFDASAPLRVHRPGDRFTW